MKLNDSIKILNEANKWLSIKQKVILATVIKTWGSSPRPVTSKMIINNKGNFLGSVSGGCVESAVISECLKLFEDKKSFKKLEFEVTDKNAWDVGLSCGGTILIFIEKINQVKKQLLDKIIQKKVVEFSIITDLDNGFSCAHEKKKPINKYFIKYEKGISFTLKKKKSGIIKNSNIFVEIYEKPIKLIIVGAVHITQHIVNFVKDLNIEVVIIDPRKYFINREKFPKIKIINKWPNEAFEEIKTNENSALISLTHDSKIDDPALKYALTKKFFYIGVLSSKKNHLKRCKRFIATGFTKNQTKKIFSPIGIFLGGKSTPEIALSITSQLVSEINKA